MAALAGVHANSTSAQDKVVSVRGKPVLVLCPLAAMAAAWAAAGSGGLLAHPLRHAITFLLLGAACAGLLPLRPWNQRKNFKWLLPALLALPMMASSYAPTNVLACALVLSGLALAWPDSDRSTLLAASWSITVLALYRFAVVSIPWTWLAADRLGAGLASGAAAIGPASLSTGATFAGIDYLVATGALFAFWLAARPARSSAGPIGLGLLVLAGHFLFLFSVASYPTWSALLPSSSADAQTAVGGADPMVRLGLWNLPALAAFIHLPIAGWMLRDIHRSTAQIPGVPGALRFGKWRLPTGKMSGLAFGIILALAVPALALLHPKPLTLQGKKIVVYEKGFLNWLKPKHGDYGRLSVGMYGMLPTFLESYGARCVVSPDLSEAALEGADLLLLIFPNQPWEEGQLDRIWGFVRAGGSLVVLGEHTVLEKEGGNRFNDVLEPTSMRVAFDSAMFAIGGWLHSYEVMAHPSTAGLADDRNQFGAVIGASVEIAWPARPLLVGRWGWADPGDASNDASRGGSMMGNRLYDSGERLGDLVLAAKQRLGKGRVVVFGDTSGFTNGILFGSHQYVSRLLAALCQGTEAGWLRQGTGLIGLLLLGVFLWQSRFQTRFWLVGPLFALSLALSTAWTQRAAAVLPDGRSSSPNVLAYLDTTHHEQCSGESWRLNGLGGLELTLMRSGYLVLGLPEFTAPRLERAGLLVSVAPGRAFSRQERTILRAFIENGGIFICTVGFPESAASRQLLAELGFFVGGERAAMETGPEPRPFGHFKAPYYNGGDYMAYVRFHAAWAVESSDPKAQALAYGPRDPSGPPNQEDPTVILLRRIGRGKVVVVADSQFPTNQNLEREGGEPFEGMRENADFWRWLISYLTDQPMWTPPKPVAQSPADPLPPPEKPEEP